MPSGWAPNDNDEMLKIMQATVHLKALIGPPFRFPHDPLANQIGLPTARARSSLMVNNAVESVSQFSVSGIFAKHQRALIMLARFLPGLELLRRQQVSSIVVLK
jgi:hypothetical protein